MSMPYRLRLYEYVSSKGHSPLAWLRPSSSVPPRNSNLFRSVSPRTPSQ
ncbi:hypothetical protein GCK32_022641 [Trichostrongylus colubriformis]|uniref:Uncharacterized protein n=1 Tax=Trichostrongylus colubriformis TaxID=6319 RepID=A0AAN8FPC3_TRICO